MKKYTKVMILIFSAICIIFATISLCISSDASGMSHKKYTKCTKVEASELETTTEVGEASPIATAGDATFLYQERTMTDIYNVLVCILIVLTFWVAWNIVRTVYRIFTDFRKF